MHAWADIAEFAVGVAAGSPVWTCDGVAGECLLLVWGEVHVVYIGELGGAYAWELGFDEVVDLGRAGGVWGEEDCAFVCVIAEYYGDFDKFAVFEKEVCLVLHEIPVYCWVVEV